ncbi:HAD-like domain-containing protein [Calycina marina]|uniref:HAD-like domain-containing protein n=1 Tax=Calycina marina TaxID=1763456 RepID=A0A9P7Z5J2_9HELO|nr:HAD-like domain-containing protein [Calycina marina]
MVEDNRPVFFFDIDNCLYPKSKKVHTQMGRLIDEYFVKHLELSQEDAYKLHMEYYKTYGLAIEGLVRHHRIDAMEYNRQVDDALPLESFIFPDPQLRKLLEDMDKTKVKLWLFTNAYKTHGERVVRLLGIEDFFEGITFCDYAEPILLCKPHPDMFKKAMRQAGISEFDKCYFVDDSVLNCAKAEELGWHTANLLEEGEPLPAEKPCKYQARHLEDLRKYFPQFFKTV